MTIALSANALTTLANLKMYIGLDLADTSQDTLLTILVNSASQRVADYCNRDFALQQYTDNLVGNNRQTITLKHYPVMSLISVTMDDNVIDLTDIDIDSEEGQLFDAASIWDQPGNLQNSLAQFPSDFQIAMLSAEANLQKRNIFITYTAGYVLPKDDSPAATPPVARTLPWSLEEAVWQLVSINYNMRGAEHTEVEAYTGWRTHYVKDIPVWITDKLDKYRQVIVT